MSVNRFQKSLIAGAAGVAALAVVGSGALAHGSGGYHQGPGQGMMGPDQGMMGPGQGMMGPGQGMMSPGQGMMGPGQGMMSPGQGMMGPGQGMMGPGQGMQVTPSRDLTAADVRHFLEHRLEMHGNDRLKVGAVEEVDDDTITAEVVTVDDSLVERFRVDRHSGWMAPERTDADGTPAPQPAN